VSLSIDTVAPAAPTISVVAGNDVINNIERLATTVSGTAEAGATVNLTVGDNVRTVQASVNGAWSYTLVDADLEELGQGSVSLSASARDSAGNTSATEGTRLVTIDTEAPTEAPSALAPRARM
jgi:hypothetical protein